MNLSLVSCRHVIIIMSSLFYVKYFLTTKNLLINTQVFVICVLQYIDQSVLFLPVHVKFISLLLAVRLRFFLPIIFDNNLQNITYFYKLTYFSTIIIIYRNST